MSSTRASISTASATATRAAPREELGWEGERAVLPLRRDAGRAEERRSPRRRVRRGSTAGASRSSATVRCACELEGRDRVVRLVGRVPHARVADLDRGVRRRLPAEPDRAVRAGGARGARVRAAGRRHAHRRAARARHSRDGRPRRSRQRRLDRGRPAGGRGASEAEPGRPGDRRGARRRQAGRARRAAPGRGETPE